MLTLRLAFLPWTEGCALAWGMLTHQPTSTTTAPFPQRTLTSLSGIWPALGATTPAPHLEPASNRLYSVAVLYELQQLSRSDEVQIPAPWFHRHPHCTRHMSGFTAAQIYAVNVLAPHLPSKHVPSQDILSKESAPLSRRLFQIKWAQNKSAFIPPGFQLASPLQGGIIPCSCERKFLHSWHLFPIHSC